MKLIEGGVCAAKGFLAAGVHCGIRKNKTKKDLALICSEKKAAAAAVYTTNLVKGRPAYRDEKAPCRRICPGGDLQQRKRQYLQCRRRGNCRRNVCSCWRRS